MIRFILLAVAAVLIVSGCDVKSRPAGANTQAPAQEAVAAAAGNADRAAAGSASAQAAAEPAVTAPAAAKTSEAAAKPETGKSEPAKPDTAKPAARQPETNAAASRDVSAPETSPAAGSAGQSERTPEASVSSAVPEKTALQISITGDTKHGVILKEISVPFREGTTALDVLKQATKDNKIQMEYKGKGTYAYVQGIDNLYEFDGGPKSGWVYKVNGRAPGEGAGAYKLKAGDRIEWLYTLNMGEDVGAKMK